MRRAPLRTFLSCCPGTERPRCGVLHRGRHDLHALRSRTPRIRPRKDGCRCSYRRPLALLLESCDLRGHRDHRRGRRRVRRRVRLHGRRGRDVPDHRAF